MLDRLRGYLLESPPDDGEAAELLPPGTAAA